MKNVVRNLLLLTALAVFGSEAFAAGSIEGKVLGTDGSAVANASIQVEGTSLGAVSRPDGSFAIDNVPAGTQALIASYILYEPERVEISVSDNSSADVTVRFDRDRIILLDEIVVTATGIETAPEKVPQPVSHISKEEIERGFYYNAGEMLDFVPGVRIIRAGGTVGADQGISIRSLNGGPSSSKSLVLLDGRPINNGWDGGMNWNTIPTELVERIEVVKGPSSALYGSQATAGVINVISRVPEEGFHGRVSIAREMNGSKEITDRNSDGYGRPDVGATNFHMNLSHRNETTSHLVTFGFRNADQSFLTPAKNKWDNFDLNYDLSHSVSEKLTTRFHLDVHNDTWKKEAERTPSENDIGYYSVDFSTKYRTKSGIWASRFYLNVDNYDERSLQTNLTTGSDAKRFGIITDYSFLFPAHSASLKFGFDGCFDFASIDYDRAVMSMTYQGVRTAGVYNKKTGIVTPRQVDLYTGTYGSKSQDYDLSNVALFAQYSQDFGDRLNLVLGGRLDSHSEFGTIFNPKAGAAWKLFGTKEYSTSLKANYGQGFRAPNMRALYSKSLGGFGDPNIEPEKTRNFDIGIFQRFGDFGYLELSYFKMKVDNLMINDKMGSTGWGNYVAIPDGAGSTDTLSFNKRKNLGDYSPSGFELGLKIKPHDQLSLQAAYTFLNPGDFSFQTSRHRFNFGVFFFQPIGKNRIEAELRYNHTGDGYYFDYNSRPFDGFGVTDMTVALDIHSRFKVSFHGRNLTDTKYGLWHYAWEPGRSFIMQLETRF